MAEQNVEVRDPCESVALLEEQRNKQRRQSSSADHAPSSTDLEDSETLKRTVRALREELARVHGNLRAQTARADLYLRKLQAFTDDEGENNGKK